LIAANAILKDKIFYCIFVIFDVISDNRQMPGVVKVI